MARLFDVAEAVATGPVLDVRQAEIAVPGRRISEIVGGLVILALMLQTPAARIGWLIAIIAIGACRSLFPTTGLIARTADSVAVIRPSTLLRPNSGPTLIAETAPSQLVRVRPGLMSDRWQVDDTSVLVQRWERRHLDRWRTDEPINTS